MRKRKRGRRSVAAFGSKRNSEGVFCGGEGWLPRDHGALWWGCRGAKGPRGTERATARQKGQSSNGETRGERGMQQQQRQLSLSVPPFVLP